MTRRENPNWFANSPLMRPNWEKDLDETVDRQLHDSESLILPLWRGDPLLNEHGHAAYLTTKTVPELPNAAPLALLGARNGRTYFAADVSRAADNSADAPFSNLGQYTPIREAAGIAPRDDVAIIGHARWLFEWHRTHLFCARCGGKTEMAPGGAKRHCGDCQTVNFPRSDPVAIVLAIHDDACLLGRGPHFPPGFLSALAGFVEAAETPEEAARREIFEEAGVRLTQVNYQFSQPWPFPSSLMMGFLAHAEDRFLTLDEAELEEARWINRADMIAALKGEARDFFLPPQFTIARQLIERWVAA